MIKNCEILYEEPSGEAVKVFTVAVGNIPFHPILMSRSCKKAIELIASQEGFLGLAPHRPYGTLCLFKTENDAKGARNILRMEGVKCGDNICEVFIDKRIVDGKSERDNKSGS